MDAFIKEQIGKVTRLQSEMIIANPDKYKMAPSESINDYKAVLLPWVEENTRKRSVTELADLIKVLDKLQDK